MVITQASQCFGWHVPLTSLANHFLNNPTSKGVFMLPFLQWERLAKRKKHWKIQSSSRAFQPRISYGDDRSRRRYANARTVGRRPQSDKAPLPTAIPKPPDLPRRGSAADGRKQDDMQDDSRRQPEGRDGQDRHGAEPGSRARQDGEPGAPRRRRSPGRPDEVPRMEGPGLARDDPRHPPFRRDSGLGRRPRGGDAPPPRGRRPHALQHRARRHGDGGVHGDVPRADDGRLARAHQVGLRLRHRRLRAHPGNNPHQRTGRRGQRPHPGFRRIPSGIRHDRPPEDRGAGQEADKPRPLRGGHPRHALRLPQQPRQGRGAYRQRPVREGVPRLRDRGAPRRFRRGGGRCG